MPLMHCYAPAKINLTLRVFGVRDDGYHALDSVVVPISLADDVELERAEETTLALVGDGVDVGALPADSEDNLALRALRLLEKHVGQKLPTRIRITKRIPLGGGLGGGSSDAATVLRGVAQLWDLKVSQEELVALGAELGSDVPLFLLDGLVRMRGRGERVERLDVGGAQGQWLVLANAGVHCATGAVYRAFDAQAGNKGLTEDSELCDTLRLSLQSGKLEELARAVRNDLERPCFELFPEVAETAVALRVAGCQGVRLCGSGGTVFGLVRTRAEGEQALAHSALAGCWRACVQTLPDGVMAAHGSLTPRVMVRIHVGQPCVAASERKEE